MQILIVRDGGATKVPREVADLAAAQDFAAQGHEVLIAGVEEGQWVPLPALDAEPALTLDAAEAPAESARMADDEAPADADPVVKPADKSTRRTEA